MPETSARFRRLGVALTLAVAVACARPAAPKPIEVAWDDATVEAGSAWVNLTLARPVPPADSPQFVVVFASGDGGLSGTSAAILEHLAQRGLWVAAFSSEEAFESVISDPESARRSNYSAARDIFEAIVAQAKRGFSLADGTPIITAGMSRGANVVIASAGDPRLRPGMIGALAIALTREFDALTVTDAAKKLSFVKTDDEGRIQTYPAIERLGSLPLAIIQSTNDDYVPSAESRRMLGADTATRRLYEVRATNHDFDGGRDVLMHDLDDAIDWIKASR
jgi:dienelactone hydrolase